MATNKKVARNSGSRKPLLSAVIPIWITLKNEDEVFDEKVSIKIFLPFVPRMGDILYLSEKERRHLQKGVDKYYKENPDDRFFVEDNIYVHKIGIHSDKKIFIELSDDYKGWGLE